MKQFLIGGVTFILIFLLGMWSTHWFPNEQHVPAKKSIIAETPSKREKPIVEKIQKTLAVSVDSSKITIKTSSISVPSVKKVNKKNEDELIITEAEKDKMKKEILDQFIKRRNCKGFKVTISTEIIRCF